MKLHVSQPAAALDSNLKTLFKTDFTELISTCHQCNADADISYWSLQVPSLVRDVSMMYLSIPATSVPCERSFSGACVCSTKRRFALLPHHLEDMALLRADAIKHYDEPSKYIDDIFATITTSSMTVDIWQ